jgi:5-(carboxyamino)imidazole ribonucleotide synthase
MEMYRIWIWNGVKVIRQISDLDELPNVECIAEEMILLKMNWRLLCAEIHQEKRTYPVVEMEFHPEANQVEYVICPARIDDAVAEKQELSPYTFLKNSIM